MAYSYYRAITIDYTKCGTANSTDFPVLVSFTDASFKWVLAGGKIQSGSGYDINFYSDIGLTTALYYQVERWNSSTGECIFWVKVPTLSATANTVIYVAYGDASITTFQSSVSAVWNSNFKSVLHLTDGTTLNVQDSTSLGNNFTNNGATATTGKIDGGASLNGTTNKISKAGLVIPTTGSLTFWGLLPVTTGTIPLFRSGSASPVLVSFDMYWYNGVLYAGWYNTNNPPINGRVAFTNTGTIVANTWYYYSLTWTNGGVTELRINDVQRGTPTTGLNTTFNTSSYTSNIGFDDVGVLYGNCRIDEFRLSSSALSSSWITSEYNNQNSPSTFYTLGSETLATSTSNFFQFF